VDEILSEFIVESTEALDQLDVELIELERNPDSTPLLSSIFRRIHTVKGTCGFLGFSKLEAVTHSGESLLSQLRDGHLVVTPEITTELLALTDAVREMIDTIASSGAEGDGDYTALEARLRELAEGTAPTAPRVGDLLVASGRATEEDVAAALDDQAAGEPPPRRRDPRRPRRDRLPGRRRRARAAGRRAGRPGLDHPRRRGPAGHADEPGRRARPQPQPDPAVHQGHRRCGAGRDTAAARPHHHRAPGLGHEDPDAADRQRLVEVPADRARPRPADRQGGRARDDRQRH
jgi:chemotaxis protein histidine kinase CheA